jgi:hypothetical protein
MSEEREGVVMYWRHAAREVFYLVRQLQPQPRSWGQS